MRTKVKWTLAISAEVVIGLATYHMSWIIKWPPKGPIEVFIGIQWCVLLFLAFSSVLWSLAGIAILIHKWRPEITRLNLPK